MDNNICSKLKGAAVNGCGECVIDNKGNTVGMSRINEFIKIKGNITVSDSLVLMLLFINRADLRMSLVEEAAMLLDEIIYRILYVRMPIAGILEDRLSPAETGKQTVVIARYRVVKSFASVGVLENKSVVSRAGLNALCSCVLGNFVNSFRKGRSECVKGFCLTE
jgi:hypothetical protein